MNLFSVPSAVARAIGSLCLTKATLAINAGSAATFKALEPSPALDRRRFQDQGGALCANILERPLPSSPDIAACSRSRWTLQATSRPFRVRSTRPETVDGAISTGLINPPEQHPGSSSVIEPIGTLG